ncbi:MAG: class I SAM-dependent methyltransferase [Hyphomonadaceae bacterium]
MRSALAAFAAAIVTACAGGAVPGIMMAAPAPVTATSPNILAAVADPRRPDADRERDALRHPAEILAFAQIQPGQRVADVGPGGGYYTRLLSVAVGEEGRVYAIDRPNTPERRRAILDVAPAYPNVAVVQQGYQGWSAGEPLDAILISQIYHDFHLPALNLNVPTVNRDLLAALKPGGVLLIIDHSAVAGSDLSVADTLHRIDAARVRSELEAAGFVFDGESEVLRNPADDRSIRVFEGDIRGRTDQFVMRFRRPAA